MESHPAHHEVERRVDLAFTAPLTETLLDPIESGSLWSNLQEIASQVERHAEQSRLIHEVAAQVPDPTTTLELAVNRKFVSAELARDLLMELSNTLSDPEHNRLLIYLPFEFLPDASWNSEDAGLNTAINLFRSTYKEAWYRLLTVHDVRANFVDGDVAEVEHRQDDLPRTVKAAHLTPVLLERGLITFDEIEEVLRTSEDPILNLSILEALDAYGTSPGQAGYTAQERDEQAAPATNVPVSERRQAWLDQRQEESEIVTKAQYLSRFILAGELKPISVSWGPEGDEAGYRAVSEGIYKAIESNAWQNLDRAKAMYSEFGPMLDELWLKANSPRTKEQAARVYRRLHRLGVVDLETLRQLGIDLPTLTGPFSENLNHMPEEIQRLKRISSKISETPGLNRVLYPVVLLNGSRLKGYGEHASDVDTGVFIRPGTVEADNENLRRLVRAVFTGEGHNDEPIEFWLKEENEKLSVRRLAEYDPHIADAYWTHTLFGSAWIGDQAEIQHIQRRLLPNYFEDSEEIIYGRKARGLYIEELERDRLQYRLLHKGYARQYPQYPRESWTHRPEIDGHAAFWDSGYRRLATQIYINSVFLPIAAK